MNVHLINLKTKRKRIVHLNRCKLSPNRDSLEEFDEFSLYADSPCTTDYHGHELEMVDEHVSEEASAYAELE